MTSHHPPFHPAGQTALLTHVRDLSNLDAAAAGKALAAMEPRTAGQVLRVMSPVLLDEVLASASVETAALLGERIPPLVAAQRTQRHTFGAGTVGRLMDPPLAILPQSLTVAEVKAALRPIVLTEFVTYAYLVDEEQRLTGVLVMRDLLFADERAAVTSIMVPSPEYLEPETKVVEAMRQVAALHFPVYPVCDAERRVIGLVRGARLFESQAYEITSQAGRLVGVEQHEHSATPIVQSFRRRHPWLQLNLLTALLAGAVVSYFRDTIGQVVILAAFLPVLAGQAASSGGQALAVTVRAMLLGQLQRGASWRAVRKEATLGLLNGVLVGLSAALGMYLLARRHGDRNALPLAAVVLVAMTGACFVSGAAGALVPLALRRIGADPAMASNIFLTTASDVTSLSLLLGLATWFVL